MKQREKRELLKVISQEIVKLERFGEVKLNLFTDWESNVMVKSRHYPNDLMYAITIGEDGLTCFTYHWENDKWVGYGDYSMMKRRIDRYEFFNSIGYGDDFKNEEQAIRRFVQNYKIQDNEYE